jgi:hypothetical protein
MDKKEVAKAFLNTEYPGASRPEGFDGIFEGIHATDDDAEQLLESGWSPEPWMTDVGPCPHCHYPMLYGDEDPTERICAVCVLNEFVKG